MNEDEFKQFKTTLEQKGVRLVAVSKVHPIERLRTFYERGQRVFGENRAQEMAGKYDELPNDVEWHMIGPLQTNKVKYIIDFVHMIESVDRLKVLKEIQKRASRIDRSINVLIQVHIAEEEQKHGFGYEEALEVIAQKDKYPNVAFRGFMGMATLTDDESKIKKEFCSLRDLFKQVQDQNPDWKGFDTLSMGMTGDYKIALSCGANCVRIGSKIFGPRPKN